MGCGFCQGCLVQNSSKIRFFEKICSSECWWASCLRRRLNGLESRNGVESNSNLVAITGSLLIQQRSSARLDKSILVREIFNSADDRPIWSENFTFSVYGDVAASLLTQTAGVRRCPCDPGPCKANIISSVQGLEYRKFFRPQNSKSAINQVLLPAAFFNYHIMMSSF